MAEEKLKWYPVYTNPRAEKKAFELLKCKGIESYLPLYRQQKQWSDRKKWILEPLIKSYVFVYILPSQIGKVLTTKGICRFIYFSGVIATMPSKQIDQLKLLLASGDELEIIERVFTNGEKIRIVAGPLQGLTGEIIEYKAQKRLLVRIDHIGQSLLVKINSVFIEAF